MTPAGLRLLQDLRRRCSNRPPRCDTPANPPPASPKPSGSWPTDHTTVDAEHGDGDAADSRLVLLVIPRVATGPDLLEIPLQAVDGGVRAYREPFERRLDPGVELTVGQVRQHRLAGGRTLQRRTAADLGLGRDPERRPALQDVDGAAGRHLGSVHGLARQFDEFVAGRFRCGAQIQSAKDEAGKGRRGGGHELGRHRLR
jgi:hypothetical protein